MCGWLGHRGKQLIKIFGHYFNRRTVVQVLFDLTLLMGVMLFVLLEMDPNPNPKESRAIIQSAILAFGVLFINTGLGFYLRVHNRTVGQTYARAALADWNPKR